MEAFGISFNFSPALQLLFTAVLASLAACTAQRSLGYPQTPHDIAPVDANKLTTAYTLKYSTDPSYVVFTKPAIEKIFPPSNTNISGIRYYFGLDGQTMVILVVGTELNSSTHANDDIVTNQILISPNSNPVDSFNAANFTKLFRETNTKQPRGGFFSADALRAVLYDYTDPNICTGLRFSYGINGNSQLTLIVRGVDNAGNEIPNGRIIDMSVPCPKDCGKKNTINNYPDSN